MSAGPSSLPIAPASPLASRRVGLTSLGCKVNQYDAAAIRERLSDAGHQCVPFDEPADVYVVNSCTVTHQADAESRQLCRRAKRRNPAAQVIMTGCYAQVDPHAVSRLAEVDSVVGLNRLDDLVRLVSGDGPAETHSGSPARERPAVFVSDLRKTAADARPGIDTFGALHFEGQTRAFLKIQEGCDLFCTFCIVPRSRGTSRSVAPRVVLDQLDRLAGRGFQEVVLTGIHLGGYGHDLDPRVDLTWLLEAIEERRPVPRVRLSSLDPHEIGPRLLQLLAESETLCPHLHVPLQSGDDTILRRMRRRYDTALARDVLAEARSRLPDAALGTDLIVGFPGEGEGEFARGLEFLEDSPFTYFHVFPYSIRAGTTAAKFPDKLPPAVIQQRAAEVRRLGQRKQAEFARSFETACLPVLFEHTRDKTSGRLKGYSRNYLRVHAPGGDPYMNREVLVRVTRSNGDRLDGEIVTTGPHDSADAPISSGRT